MTKNRTPTLVYLDPGMQPGLEVKGLNTQASIKQANANLSLCGFVMMKFCILIVDIILRICFI